MTIHELGSVLDETKGPFALPGDSNSGYVE
jgi:hypothetical protein